MTDEVRLVPMKLDKGGKVMPANGLDIALSWQNAITEEEAEAFKNMTGRLPRKLRAAFGEPND